MNVYVSNIAYPATDEALQEAFAAHGTVSSARIIKDRATGRSRGFGFVEMPNDEEARKALEALNGLDLMGRAISVREARPREEGGAGGKGEPRGEQQQRGGGQNGQGGQQRNKQPREPREPREEPKLVIINRGVY